MRVSNAFITRKRRKGWIRLAKGYWGHRSVAYKTAKQAVVKSWTYAFRDRKKLKRDYRSLWVTRISAACKIEKINYSTFLNKLKRMNILINRKMLSEIAIKDPKTFSNLVKLVK